MRFSLFLTVAIQLGLLLAVVRVDSLAADQLAGINSFGTFYYTSSADSTDRISHSFPLESRPNYKFLYNISDTKNGNAVGNYNENESNAINSNGWNILDIKTIVQPATAAAITDNDIMFSAGFIEGALGWQQIEQVWPNYMTEFFGSTTVPVEIINFIQENDEWMRKEIAAAGPADPYWSKLSLIISQLEGLTAGYLFAAPSTATPMNYWNMMLLNLDGDLEDLQPALVPSHRNKRIDALVNEASPYKRNETHCSVMIKFVQNSTQPGDSDIFFNHNTFDNYPSMTRVFKHYTFQLNQNGLLNISFSSSPGFLSSVDDYYLISSPAINLAITETTNSIYNASLWKEIRSNTVMSWIRAMMANYNSIDCNEWISMFVLYNSGTYNNQWICLNYHLYDLSRIDSIKQNIPHTSAQLYPNTLMIVETMPLVYNSGDVTEYLINESYWASYNIPFFANIYNISGTLQQYEENGNGYSWSQCPRANIFRREQSSVVDYQSNAIVMTYNRWQTDPFSLGDPCNAPMARCDLSSTEPQAFGGIDSKITNFAMSKLRKTMAMNGPTHTDQVPFDWRQSDGIFFGQPHNGQPNVFAFPHVPMQPFQF